MRIRMIKTAAGPDGIWMTGKIYDLPDALAKQYIGAGAAISLEPVAIETEAVEPQEKAILPRGRAKKSKRDTSRG